MVVHEPLPAPQPTPVLTLEPVIQDILRRWPIIMIGGVAGLSLGLLHLAVADVRFTATVTLAPVLQEGSTGSRLERLGSLGSLAGLGAAFGRNSIEFRKFFEVVKSRAVADTLAEDTTLLRRVFKNEWDPDAGKWRPSAGVTSKLQGFLAEGLGIGLLRWTAPDGERLQRLLRRRLLVIEDPDSPFVRMSIEMPDRLLAADLLKATVETSDDLLRGAAVVRSTRRIEYIDRKIAEGPVAELRNALASELAEQERVRIFASSGAPFSAEPLTPISVSERPTWPIPLVSVGVGAGLGALVGAVLSAWLGHRRRSATARSALETPE